MRLWRRRGKHGSGISEARAERARSEVSLRHAQEHVIAPLYAIHERNHFAEMLRDDILAGYRRRAGGA